jgi:putative phosphonate metabolism protein
MKVITRYAVYYAPGEGALADFAARWLGWDPAGGRAVAHPVVRGLPQRLDDITATPRKYGFHGTIKAPFHLLEGTRADDVKAALAGLCDQLAPVTLPGLRLQCLGGFVALTPHGGIAELGDLAATVVARLDGFRAPPSAAEIARRKPDRLSPNQRDNLARWGYPHVMDDFQFHLTLTGDLPVAQAQAVLRILGPMIMPLVPVPFVIDSLCLFGEAEDGFHLLHRYPLTG